MSEFRTPSIPGQDMSGQPSQPGDRRPRVVMLLTNPFTHDTRVFKEARTLAECGVEVIVLARAQPWLPDVEHRDGIEIRRVVLRVDDFLVMLRLIARAPFKGMLRRALMAPAQPAKAIPRRGKKKPTLKQRLADLRTAPRRMTTAGWNRSKKHLPPAGRLLAFNSMLAQEAARLRPDLVVAHDLTTLLAGALVKRATGCRLVYDSHELFLERNIGDKSRRVDKLWWGPIEHACIPSADAVFTVAEGICRELERRYRIPEVHLLRNVQPYEPPPAPSSLLHDELALPASTRVAIYAGAITVNRGLEQLIDAAPMLDRTAAVIMGYGKDEYVEALRRRAEANGSLGRSLFFKDAVPMEDVTRWVASADLGVVPTQGVCLSYRYEASNKIFHCVMSGVPLAMSDHPEKRLLAERHGIGVLFDERDPAQIAGAINAFLNDAPAMAAAKARCLEAARDLNWERERDRFVGIMGGLLGRPLCIDPGVEAAEEQLLAEAQPTAAAG